MEFLHGVLEDAIKGIFKEINDKVMGKCIGMMEIFIEVNGVREFNMGWVSYL
jgi:hypothetical protein